MCEETLYEFGLNMIHRMENNFMKKLKALILLFIMVLLFSGCITSETEITLKNDDSGTVTFNMEIAKYLFEYSGAEFLEIEEMVEEAIEEIEAEGYQATSQIEDDNIIIQATKDFDDIEGLEVTYLSTELDYEGDEAQPVVFEKEVDGKNVKITGGPLTDREYVGDFQEDDMMLDMFDSNFKITFKVNLPSKPINHNATSVNGNTLTWDVFELEKEGRGDDPIEFEYKRGSLFGSSMLPILGGIGVVALVIAVMFWFINRRKKEGA